MKVWRISTSISMTIADIWRTKFGTEHKYHTTNISEWPNRITWKSKMAAANNSGLDKDICIQFYGIMHWTLAYNSLSVITLVQAVLKVWTVVSCSNNFSTKHGTVVAGWATRAPQKLCGPRTPYHTTILQLQKCNNTANINVKNCGLDTS